MSNDNKDIGPELMDFLDDTPYSKNYPKNISPTCSTLRADRTTKKALTNLRYVDPNSSFFHKGISYEKPQFSGRRTSGKTYKGKKSSRVKAAIIAATILTVLGGITYALNSCAKEPTEQDPVVTIGEDSPTPREPVIDSTSAQAEEKEAEFPILVDSKGEDNPNYYLENYKENISILYEQITGKTLNEVYFEVKPIEISSKNGQNYETLHNSLNLREKDGYIVSKSQEINVYSVPKDQNGEYNEQNRLCRVIIDKEPDGNGGYQYVPISVEGSPENADPTLASLVENTCNSLMGAEAYQRQCEDSFYSRPGEKGVLHKAQNNSLTQEFNALRKIYGLSFDDQTTTEHTAEQDISNVNDGHDGHNEQVEQDGHDGHDGHDEH